MTLVAEASAFAGASDQMFVAADIALNPDEAVFEPTAAQVVSKSAHDESWKRPVVSCQFASQTGEVLFHKRVEHTVFRFMTPIKRRR